MTAHKLNLGKLIILSILTTCIFLPIVYIIPHFKGIISGNYGEYNMRFTSLSEYLGYIFESFWFVSIAFFIVNQIPYALFRLYFGSALKLTLFREIVCYFLFNCLTILISGWGALFYINPWAPDYKYTFVVSVLVFSLAVIVFQKIASRFLLKVL